MGIEGIQNWLRDAPHGLPRWVLVGSSSWIALWGIRSAARVVDACSFLGLPLDDSYIHLRYAETFADLRPFVYSPDQPPSAGSTSLLWPMVLALFRFLGFSGHWLAGVAWALGSLAWFGLTAEGVRLAQGLVRKGQEPVVAGLCLGFAPYLWFAGSGMEVMAFAWGLARAGRSIIEVWELDRTGLGTLRKKVLEVIAFCGLVPLVRPEGVILVVPAAAALLKALRGTNRAALLMASLGALVLGPATASLILVGFTGEPSTTTATAKWLPENPYYQAHEVLGSMVAHFRLFLLTLLDGHGWTPMFLPADGAPVFWAALLALGWRTFRQATRFRAAVLLYLAAGVVLPTSYETFLVNRLRYLWPFFLPWLIGLAVLTDILGQRISALAGRLTGINPDRLGARLTGLTGLVAIAALVSKMPGAQHDLTHSAQAIADQQIAMAAWIKDHLPQAARIGINDAGAIAYFSERRTFDVVGLTTRGEAEHWVQGPGSRFEHYEHLGPERLPTHFAVYPEWFALDFLLGEELYEREVWATILGGARLVLHEADYRLLGSAREPDAPPGGGSIQDALDVADVESERAHDYHLFDASRETNRVFHSGKRAEGGRDRRTRERFSLVFSAAEARLGLRLVADAPGSLAIRVGGALAGEIELSASTAWQEHWLPLPPHFSSGKQWVEITVKGPGAFAALHYWSWAAPETTR